MKCQKNECDKLVHHLCQSEWEQREGHINTVAMYCCLHHPNNINKTQSETNAGSQGTERIDSAGDKSVQVLHNTAQAPSTKMVVLELIQCQVQIPNWMQLKVVL